MSITKSLLPFFALLGVFFFQTAHTTSLSPVETKINHYITQHQVDQLSLLEQLVNINSGTTNIAGVHQVQTT